jgi:hypothetical protein
MNSDIVLRTFIRSILFKPRVGVVLFGFFLALFFSFGVRNSELKNTLLVNTNSFNPVYSVDTLPILTEKGDSIGFINPYFVFYIDSMPCLTDPGIGHLYAWIWNESLNINSEKATTLTDENIRTGENRDILGRIYVNSFLEVIFHRTEYQWSLIMINTAFESHARLILASNKDLKPEIFHKQHLYTTDLSYFSVHKVLRLRFIDLSTLFKKQPNIFAIMVYQIFSLGCLLLVLIANSEKRNRLFRLLAFSCSYFVGTGLCLIINWVISLYFKP